jgi:ADP-heptose:LPS heptosyltransferase
MSIAGMVDCIVSPDTSLVHIGAALRKPTAGVFFSIDPDLRVRHMPTVRGYCPPAFRKSPYWTAHKVESADALAALDTKSDYIAAWEGFDVGEVRKLLEEVAR